MSSRHTHTRVQAHIDKPTCTIPCASFLISICLCFAKPQRRRRSRKRVQRSLRRRAGCGPRGTSELHDRGTSSTFQASQTCRESAPRQQRLLLVLIDDDSEDMLDKNTSQSSGDEACTLSRSRASSASDCKTDTQLQKTDSEEEFPANEQSFELSEMQLARLQVAPQAEEKK
jgi:hypothetical protein